MLLHDVHRHAERVTRRIYLECVGCVAGGREVAAARIFDRFAVPDRRHLDPDAVTADLDRLQGMSKRVRVRVDSGFLEEDDAPAALAPLYGELELLDFLANRYELLVLGPGPTGRTRG